MDLLDKLAMKIGGGKPSSEFPESYIQELEEIEKLGDITTKSVKEIPDSDDNKKTKKKKSTAKHTIKDHVDYDEIFSISEINKMDRKSLGDTLSRHGKTKSYNEIISKNKTIRDIGLIDTDDEEILGKRIPFLNQKMAFGVWVYRKRYGIISTMVIYISILLGIQFYSIRVTEADLTNGIFIDLSQVELIEETLEETLEELEQENQELKEQQELYEQMIVENRLVDENFEEQEEDAVTETVPQQITQEVEVESESGETTELDDIFADNQAALDARRKAKEEAIEEPQQKRYKNINKVGNVTVLYNLQHRYVIDSEVPAYRCKGGGKIEVEITVERNGIVSDASIVSGKRVSDQCLPIMALEAAKMTRFNIDNSAPRKQIGLITFTFVAQ